MQACIHRGAHEVGGSCVEVEHDGPRLILDVGLPLGLDADEVTLPPVRGLGSGDSSIVGLVISHGHPDHYGLIARASASIPRYLGEATQRVLREATFFTGGGADITATGYLNDRTPIQLGPFTVTPYLVDHSAFDSYALLIEAGGSRLMYSGDLRAHGRKAALFERLVRNPPADVDVLLLEGTNIRAEPGAVGTTEQEVEESCVELFRRTDGMVLAAFSPQNIDRLVTFFRAAKRSGRTLVLDLYAATIARATGAPTIPQATWDGVRVLVPNSQRIKVKEAQEFERINWLHGHRIYPEELAHSPASYVTIFRASMGNELVRAGALRGAHAIWSMWRGYLEQPSGQRLRDWLADRGIPLSIVHSSGHATTADLQRLAMAIGAREVVPIHTDQAGKYPALFENVRLRGDGEWWEVSR